MLPPKKWSWMHGLIWWWIIFSSWSIVIILSLSHVSHLIMHREWRHDQSTSFESIYFVKRLWETEHFAKAPVKRELRSSGIYIYISGRLAVASWSYSCFSKGRVRSESHTDFSFEALAPLRPLPHIYHCYISYIIYHCCILVGANNAATRWWQSLRNSPFPFLLSPTPLAFVIHPRPQVITASLQPHCNDSKG